MYIALLKLPDGKDPCDLDGSVKGLLNEESSVNVEDYKIDTLVTELYEVPNRGVIEYRHSKSGNNIPTNFNLVEDDRTQRTQQILTSGYLLLVGFNEISPYFSKLKSKIHQTLDDYIVAYDTRDYLINNDY